MLEEVAHALVDTQVRRPSVAGHCRVPGCGGDAGRQMVTGEGELVTCSPTRRRRLFQAVLGGLGQCGIIVRATLRMVPAPTMALLVRLRYKDL